MVILIVFSAIVTPIYIRHHLEQKTRVNLKYRESAYLMYLHLVTGIFGAIRQIGYFVAHDAQIGSNNVGATRQASSHLVY